jgi:hypothetical protein
VEDDHVDRPGVDVQQCMKLTGTNSPIGLIVLIDHAHRMEFDEPSVQRSRMSGSSTLCSSQGRRTTGDGLWPVWVLFGIRTKRGAKGDVFKIDKRGKRLCQLLNQHCP